MKEYHIDGKCCYIAQNGSGGPVFLLGTSLFREDILEHTWECICELAGSRAFVLAAFLADDWNREFSPWKASGITEEEKFDGDGQLTLNWVLNSFIPFIKENIVHDDNAVMIPTGYSLAGLWALWSLYENSCFSGAVCCSGSLWFPGWKEYRDTQKLKQESYVYLSLGGKEDKTSNAVMASVGIRTREQEKILKKNEYVKKVILEWNSGGHFADSGKRLAKGIRWMIDELARKETEENER